jgi:hypothetical protein
LQSISQKLYVKLVQKWMCRTARYTHPCYASRKSMQSTYGEHSAAFVRQVDSADAALTAAAPAGQTPTLTVPNCLPRKRTLAASGRL